MTVKPNGSNTFGFTMDNGNTSARPRITSCTASCFRPVCVVVIPDDDHAPIGTHRHP
jgi:hypothetical protein